MAEQPGNRRVRVGLVQINNSFSGQNYLPLSVGMLQAYAQKNLSHPECFDFLLPIYTRLPVQEALRRLCGADVVLLSTYIWNIRISLEIARQLKQLAPSILTVFGGPQVPERPHQNEPFLRRNPFIDIACVGEGEQVTVKLLEQVLSGQNDWESVPSLTFIAADGRHVMTPRASRLNDLDAIPSPFLSGTFIPLMSAHPQEHWIGLWETNRGCPFSCTFCDWGSATAAKVYKFDLERLRREVEWFADNRVEFIFCCDANFGMLPRDIEIARTMAEVKRVKGYPHAMSVQNTKNATERAYEVQKILSNAGLNKGVDLALQSTDPGTLTSIKRGNISTETYQELQRRFARDNVETYTDLILGLPGETYDSFASGVSNIIANGQHNRIQFNNLSILPNAEMGDPEYQKRYGMEIVQIKVVNIHGSLTQADSEVVETQDLVIATASMPREDWVRARAFSWMAGLLHFDRVLQIPLILLHEIWSISYRELFELFLQGSLEDFPILSSIRDFFFDQAKAIQRGGYEYCQSKEWLNIWWPADEYLLIELCVKGKLEAFYREVEGLFSRLLEGKRPALQPELLHSAIELNRGLLKMPFQETDLVLELPYNVWEFCQAVVCGESVPLENRPTRHTIDRVSETWPSWEDWFREVIWYGNKRGAYRYGHRAVGVQLAGHY